MKYLDLIGRICMQSGAVIFLSGLFIYVFRDMKLFRLFGDITLKFNKTVIFIPLATFFIMSIAVSLAIKGIKIILQFFE